MKLSPATGPLSAPRSGDAVAALRMNTSLLRSCRTSAYCSAVYCTAASWHRSWSVTQTRVAREPAGVGLTFVESGPSEPRGTGRVSTNPTAPTLYQVTQVLGVGDSVHGQRPPRGVGWVNSRTRASQ